MHARGGEKLRAVDQFRNEARALGRWWKESDEVVWILEERFRQSQTTASWMMTTDAPIPVGLLAHASTGEHLFRPPKTVFVRRSENDSRRQG